MSNKDLATQAGFPILTVDYPGCKETPHASSRPLVRLDQGTHDSVPRLEQAATQRPGSLVLRHDSGTLLLPGQRRFLHGRLAGTARTLGAQSPARVVSARRMQVRPQAG